MLNVEESIPSGIIVAVLFATLFLGLLDNQIISPILVEVAKGLGVGDRVTIVGNSVSIYALAAAMAGLIIGPLADRRGRVRFLKWATIVFGGAALLSGLATGPATFFAARFLTGLAAGVFSAGVIAHAADLFPYAHRGRVMGIIATAYFAAPILGVPLGTYVAGRAGWRAIFFIFAALSIVIWFAMRRYLFELLRPPGRQLLKTRYADFFRSRSAAAGLASALFTSAGMGGFFTYLGAWLGTTFAVRVELIGIIFFVCGIASLIGAPLSGALADRTGKKSIIVLSSFAQACILLVLPSADWGLFLFAVLGLLGLVASFRVGPLQALVTELVHASQRNTYIGLRNAVSQIGIGLSVFISGKLYGTKGFIGIIYFTMAMSVIAGLTVLFITEPDKEAVASKQQQLTIDV